MQATSRIVSKLFAIAMVVAMALTLSVSAFAVEIQPYNADATNISAAVSYSGQSYSVLVTAPPEVTKISATATLYQKTLFGRKQIDTVSSTVNGRRCNVVKSVTIEEGKTYIVEVTADVYSSGVCDTVKALVTAKT